MAQNLLEDLRRLFPVEEKSGQDINPIVFGLIKQGVSSVCFFNVEERQIRTILKSVPKVFPENGEINGYRKMSFPQRMLCRRVAKIGEKRYPVEVIEEIINQGVKLKLVVDVNFKDDEFCRAAGN